MEFSFDFEIIRETELETTFCTALLFDVVQTRSTYQKGCALKVNTISCKCECVYINIYT